MTFLESVFGDGGSKSLDILKISNGQISASP